jgi:hypothetical protein
MLFSVTLMAATDSQTYPLPNLPPGSFGANTYATPSKVTTNADQFSLRIDHKLSTKNQFFARFTMDNLNGQRLTLTRPPSIPLSPSSILIGSATSSAPSPPRTQGDLLTLNSSFSALHL